jgi:putative GTP pyrophosphokinase
VATSLTKRQVDRLGDRLQRGKLRDNDLRLLDEFRWSFRAVHERVVEKIRKHLSIEPAGRRTKSTMTITNKLRRQGLRLSEMYDIAGCRLVVPDMAEQDRMVRRLQGLFDAVRVADRRQQPSFGYRAVHVIVRFEGRLYEIQVRTPLQHLWAQVSERAADVFGPAIKYGGGDDLVRSFLLSGSMMVAKEEAGRLEQRDRIARFLNRVADFVPKWREHDLSCRV